MLANPNSLLSSQVWHHWSQAETECCRLARVRISTLLKGIISKSNLDLLLGIFIKAGLYQLIITVATQTSFLVFQYSQRDLCQISNF